MINENHEEVNRRVEESNDFFNTLFNHTPSIVTTTIVGDSNPTPFPGTSNDINIGNNTNPSIGEYHGEKELPTIVPDPVETNEALSYLLGLKRTKDSTIKTTTQTEDGIVVDHNSHGRTKGATEIPPNTRELMGTLVRLGSTQTQVADAFGTSTNPVHRAVTGEFKKEKDEITSRIENTVNKVVDSALNKLVLSLDALNEEDLEGMRPKDLTAVSANLSKVVSNLRGRTDKGELNHAQLIVYAPTQVLENHYDTVELN